MSRRARILAGGGAGLVMLALLIVALGSRSAPAPPAPTPASAPAPVSARAGSGCRSYPRPGTMASGATPSDLSAEYDVLTRPQQTRDQLAPRWLRSLPVSGITTTGVRLLAHGSYGGAFLVPARHLLAFPLIPRRCVPPGKRRVERSLEQQLHRQYRRQALCVVIVSHRQESPFCDAAPGTVDPLQAASGTSWFGMVPDGVASVRILFIRRAARRIKVRRNLWIVDQPAVVTPPCGVEWLDGVGTVLRTIQSCSRDST